LFIHIKVAYLFERFDHEILTDYRNYFDTSRTLLPMGAILPIASQQSSTYCYGLYPVDIFSKGLLRVPSLEHFHCVITTSALKKDK